MKLENAIKLCYQIDTQFNIIEINKSYEKFIMKSKDRRTIFKDIFVRIMQLKECNYRLNCFAHLITPRLSVYRISQFFIGTS